MYVLSIFYAANFTWNLHHSVFIARIISCIKFHPVDDIHSPPSLSTPLSLHVLWRKLRAPAKQNNLTISTKTFCINENLSVRCLHRFSLCASACGAHYNTIHNTHRCEIVWPFRYIALGFCHFQFSVHIRIFATSSNRFWI